MKAKRFLMRLAALALAGGSFLAHAGDRPFGYMIGDIVEQRIHLSVAGRALVPVELPRRERVGVSLWRREVRQELGADGESWLVLRYQIINAPQALTVWRLPALHLASADPALALDIPEWAFSVGPITPSRPFEEANLPSLRPDHEPGKIGLAPFQHRMALAAMLLALTLLLWTAYACRMYRSNLRSLPFARAVRDLRSLRENSPESWRRLQHALNDCAGQVVRADSLDALFRRAPYLACERPALEQFCRDVNALFFGGGLPDGALSAHELAARLWRCERRAS